MSVLSPVAAYHAANPQYAGELGDATHFGSGGVPGEGPYISLWLKVVASEITSVGFACNGCPSSLATGSVLTTLLKGRSVEKAMLIDGREGDADRTPRHPPHPSGPTGRKRILR